MYTTLGANTPLQAASPYQLAALDPGGGGAAAGAYGHSLKQGMAPHNPYVYHSLDAAEAALAQQQQQQERAQHQLSAYPFAGLATSETGWTPGELSHYSTDEFRMFQFKVYRCTKRFAHDWRTCPFAHPTENARRRDPNQYRYSATACPDYKQGFCLRGEMCPYSHGVFESWLHPSRYRTQLCKDGTACSRPLCFFAHSLPELRAPTHTWVPTSEDLQPAPQQQTPFALQPAQRSNSQPADTPGSPSQSLVQAAAQLAAVSLNNEDSSDDSSKPSDSLVGNAGPGSQPPRSHARAALPRQPYKSHPHHHMQRGGGGGARPSPAHTAPSAAALGLTTPRMSNAFARRHGLNPKDNAMLNLQKIAIQAQLANGGVPPQSANTNSNGSGNSGSGSSSVRALGSKAGQHSSSNDANNSAAGAAKQSPHAAAAAAAAGGANGLLDSSSLSEQLSSQQQLQQELSNAAALNHVAAAAANAAASLPSHGNAAAAPSPQSAAAAAVAAVAAAADQHGGALGSSSNGSGAAHAGGRLSNNGGSGASSHHSNSSHNSSLHLSNLSRDSSGPISAGSAGSSGHSNANSSGSPLGMLPASVPSAAGASAGGDAGPTGASAPQLLQPSMATAAPPTPPLMHMGGANQAAAAAGATHGMMLPLLQPAGVGAGGACDALLGGGAKGGGGVGAALGSSSAAQADAATLAALQQHFQAMSFAQPSVVQEQQAQQQAQRIELQAQVQVQQQEQQAQQNHKLLQDYMHSIQQQQQSTY